MSSPIDNGSCSHLIADKIITNFKGKPSILHSGTEAFYSPKSDSIQIPTKETFLNSELYYSTLFHELGHSTGHEKRLNRDTLTAKASFGDSVYSKEELVAEFCASFLCAHSKIDSSTIENSASYIDGWSRFLRSNSRVIIEASSKGRQASEFILGKTIARDYK